MKVAAEQLRALLPQQPPGLTPHDDYDLLPRAGGLGAVKAAVLLPLVLRDEPSLMFTRRTENLARHSGQVSFPGGRSELSDLTPVETALRETFEETGIAPGLVSVAGYLERYTRAVEKAYPASVDGLVLLPFPRLFIVAIRV